MKLIIFRSRVLKGSSPREFEFVDFRQSLCPSASLRLAGQMAGSLFLSSLRGMIFYDSSDVIPHVTVVGPDGDARLRARRHDAALRADGVRRADPAADWIEFADNH
jgi:hypothetical protein